MTGLRSSGYDHFLLGAGQFVANLDLDSLHDLDDLRAALARETWRGENVLGMTRGGGQFVVHRSCEYVKIDGQQVRRRGTLFVDKLDGFFTGVMVEVRRENIARLAAIAEGGNGFVFSSPSMTSLAWIGPLADGRMVVIECQNPAGAAEMALTFADTQTGQIPFELHAEHAADDPDEVAPFRIIFFEDECAIETITGSALDVTCAADGQIKRLYQVYTPIQSGEGDPSADNIRPFVGHPYATGTVIIDGDPLPAVVGIHVDDCNNVPAPCLFGYRLDRIEGILYKTHEYYHPYMGEDLPGPWLSDRDVMSDDTPLPTRGADVVALLPRPKRYRVLCGPAPRQISEGEQLAITCDDAALQLMVVLPLEA